MTIGESVKSLRLLGQSLGRQAIACGLVSAQAVAEPDAVQLAHQRVVDQLAASDTTTLIVLREF